METEKHTILITVANRVGVMARVAGLLSSRGFNIESIVGAPTEDPDIYKITLTLFGTEEKIEQLAKQLNKLIDTIKVVEVSHGKSYIIREYLLLKVSAKKSRTEIFELIRVFNAKVVDVTKTHLTIDLAGPPIKIQRLIDLLMPYGIKEYVRTGGIALGEN